MKQEEIKKLVKEHGEKVAPNDFEKTKLARKYNTETRFYDETIGELLYDLTSQVGVLQGIIKAQAGWINELEIRLRKLEK